MTGSIDSINRNAGARKALSDLKAICVRVRTMSGWRARDAQRRDYLGDGRRQNSNNGIPEERANDR